MGALLVLMSCFANPESAPVWIDARQAPLEIQIPEAADYHVWAWVDLNGTGALSVGGQRIDVAPRPKEREKGWRWRQVKKLPLQAGAVELRIEGAVAAVAISPDKAFAPEACMRDRRVLDEPRAVRDRRALTAKHTDTVFTMPHFGTPDEWEVFAEKLRMRILLSSGLYPLPEKTPLNAVVTGRIERENYTVEKAHFDAYPGFLVTGNLYRPLGSGPFPAVICPHGHWKKGRIEDGERGSVPGRAITLARMGAVVFTYDMIGYNDSLQFKHRWGGAREKLWGLHPFSLQLWSSIRAIDFVSGLEGVDPERIGCTGASGGGTQTFAVMAVDSRVKVAAPVNMISSTMQGGCLCENAPILRLANSNMEIGALMAPRPLLLVSATGDWTRETPRVEYPAIRSIYRLYDAEEKVENVHVDAGHNYNQASREAMYRFFGKWLIGGEGDFADFKEPAFEVESTEDLRVFPEDTLPEGYAKQEALITAIIEARAAAMLRHLPGALEAIPAFRERFGTVLAGVTGAHVPGANELAPERTFMEEREGYVLEGWIVRRPEDGSAVPALLYRAPSPEPQEAVLLVHGKGKAVLAGQAKGGPGSLVRALMDEGKAVLTIDVFLAGEHHAPGQSTRRKQEGNFMDTFQPTGAGYRIQDVLTGLAFLRARRDMAERLTLAGLGEAGIACLFASAIDGNVAATVVDSGHFDPGDDEAWVGKHYIPCIRSVGDVKTAMALIHPRDLVVMNTGEPGRSHPLGTRFLADPLSTEALASALQ